jgi:hypothetical protein
VITDPDDVWPEHTTCQFGEVKANGSLDTPRLRLGNLETGLSASQAMALGHWLITHATMKISREQAELERNTIRMRNQRR